MKETGPRQTGLILGLQLAFTLRDLGFRQDGKALATLLELAPEFRRHCRVFHNAREFGIELIQLPGQRAASGATRQMRRDAGLRSGRQLLFLELPPLPEEFFKEKTEKESEPKSAHSDFGWGLFWLLGGLALLVALYFNNDKRAVALYALIPVAIGLHYLIYYYLIGKKKAAALESEWKASAGQPSQETR